MIWFFFGGFAFEKISGDLLCDLLGLRGFVVADCRIAVQNDQNIRHGKKKCWVLRHLVDKQTFSNQGWWWKDDVPMSCFRGLKSFLGQHGGGSAGLAIISVTYVPLSSILIYFWFLAQCAAPDFANLQHQNLFLGPVSRFWAPCRVVFRTFGNQATRYYTFVLGLGSELWSGTEFGVWIWNGSSSTLGWGNLVIEHRFNRAWNRACWYFRLLLVFVSTCEIWENGHRLNLIYRRPNSESGELPW